MLFLCRRWERLEQPVVLPCGGEGEDPSLDGCGSSRMLWSKRPDPLLCLQAIRTALPLKSRETYIVGHSKASDQDSCIDNPICSLHSRSVCILDQLLRARRSRLREKWFRKLDLGIAFWFLGPQNGLLISLSRKTSVHGAWCIFSRRYWLRFHL